MSNPTGLVDTFRARPEGASRFLASDALEQVRFRGMVLASHVVISFYGFWLPNDPRGSNSVFVRSWRLLPFGLATKVKHRRSVAHDSHDRALRLAAKKALCYKPVVINGRQARAIARGFAKAVERNGYVIFACSILPTHIHLVIARHRYGVEQIVNLLKGAATRQLVDEGLHPLAKFPRKDGSLPSPWAKGLRKVFRSTPAEVQQSIGYAWDNLADAGLKPQSWSFIAAYNG